MENKKTIVILSVLVAVFGLGFVGMTFYSMGIKKGQEGLTGEKTAIPDPMIGIPGQNNETNNQPIHIAEKEKQPEVMTGSIEKIEGDKFILKQIASIDLSYEIAKEDVSEIVFLEKNSNFNSEKAAKMQAEMMKLLPTASTNPPVVSANSNTPPAQPELSDEAKKKMKEFQEDPEIRQFNEVKKSWSDLKTEMQVNIMIETGGKRKLTVYPDDFQTGGMPTQE